jgi:DNA topoisomerase-2
MGRHVQTLHSPTQVVRELWVEMKETVRKLDHIEHILLRPDTYVGSTSKVTEEAWVVGAEGTFLDRQVLTYSPALLKIFDELLVNAIDRNALYPKDVNTIAVSVDDSTGAITVENNGPLGGLAVEIHATHGIYNPELIFGHLMTSTNYDDSVKRIVGGRNGYGAKLCNVYSRQFSIKVKDHVNKKTYNQHWTENMRSCMKPNIRSFSGATSSVAVTFIPDWTRFGMSGLDADFVNIIRKRCWTPPCARARIAKSSGRVKSWSE